MSVNSRPTSGRPQLLAIACGRLPIFHSLHTFKKLHSNCGHSDVKWPLARPWACRPPCRPDALPLSVRAVPSSSTVRSLYDASSRHSVIAVPVEKVLECTCRFVPEMCPTHDARRGTCRNDVVRLSASITSTHRWLCAEPPWTLHIDTGSVLSLTVLSSCQRVRRSCSSSSFRRHRRHHMTSAAR